MKLLCLCLSVLLLGLCTIAQGKYEPNWDSLDLRPLPQWYDEAKVGIFIHWGVFSVPSFGSEWFWFNWKERKDEDYINFMNKNYRPGFSYADFAPMFTAEFFDPNEWAEIFEASGAKYVVLTSKHHEGYTNWPSKVSFNWNSEAVGPKRDLVGELAAAIRKNTKIHFGLYHSLYEWFNPLYLLDKQNNFTTQYFPASKTLPELYELVYNYQPEVIWSDGDWDAPDTYWNSTSFLAWLFNNSPVKDTVVVNDRWGKGDRNKHGSFFNGHDRNNPGVLQPHKWENCMTIDRLSWGYRRNAKLSDYMSTDDLIEELAETVSCGGNILINVGPTHDGMILPVFEERLRQLGSWLKVNGEAIYGSRPWKYQNDTVTPGVWYTSARDKFTNQPVVYAIVLDWPTTAQLTLGAVTPTTETIVTMVGLNPRGYSFKWWQGAGGMGIAIQIPAIPVNTMPCEFAWVFKFTNV